MYLFHSKIKGLLLCKEYLFNPFKFSALVKKLLESTL